MDVRPLAIPCSKYIDFKRIESKKGVKLSGLLGPQYIEPKLSNKMKTTF